MAFVGSTMLLCARLVEPCNISCQLVSGLRQVITRSMLYLSQAVLMCGQSQNAWKMVLIVVLLQRMHQPSHFMTFCHAPTDMPPAYTSYFIAATFLGSHGCHDCL
uniref:Secreted protein n=1 Tax=Physcomitrium patens TaxID=3218 RepID=A0A2K1IU49_PHYPA|nr:hypothetical protein PHYPA_024749 [Physcomitrium patens]